MTIPPGAPRKAAGRIFYALTSPSAQLCKKSVIGDRKNGSPTKKNGSPTKKNGTADRKSCQGARKFRRTDWTNATHT